MTFSDADPGAPDEPTSTTALRPGRAAEPPGPDTQAGDRSAPSLADLGDVLGKFRLLTELGSGGQGRVVLATQTDLADRPVVLKLTPCDGGEHLSLARLQHTHIVPLYGVRDEPALHLRLLCMPYFGSATLSRLLDALAENPVAKRTGRDVLAALDRLQSATPGPPPPASATAPGRL